MGGPALQASTNLVRGAYSSADDLFDIIQDKLESIKTPGDVTSWMDICRTARQPQILWHVDYIEPRKSLIKINNLIRKSEIILYGDKTLITLKDGYSADLQQQSAFNTIRAHLRSDEGDFNGALSIFEDLLDDFYDRLSTIRQSNLLMHCCLAFVCCGRFGQSHKCFKKHWVLLKSLSEDQRLSLGIWDNHVILHMIYWHIASHIKDFRDFYEIESGIENGIMEHKKVALLKCLEYDQTWVASFMGLPFHQKLCKLYPEFVKWDKKTTTTENFRALWEKNPGESIRKEKPGAPSIEKQYYERYNKQFLPHTRANEDEVENCLYSFYYFQASKAEEASLQDSLNMFLNKHLDTSKYETVLSVGPGSIYPSHHHGRTVTVVDISETVCQELKPNVKIKVVHRCMSKYVRETGETFDLCMARDVLQNLSRSRLDIFLHYLPKICVYLAASIDLKEDVRTDIISEGNFATDVHLHKTVLTKEEWIGLLQQSFNIQHEIQGHYLYVYGQSKT